MEYFTPDVTKLLKMIANVIVHETDLHNCLTTQFTITQTVSTRSNMDNVIIRPGNEALLVAVNFVERVAAFMFRLPANTA